MSTGPVFLPGVALLKRLRGYDPFFYVEGFEQRSHLGLIRNIDACHVYTLLELLVAHGRTAHTTDIIGMLLGGVIGGREEGASHTIEVVMGFLGIGAKAITTSHVDRYRLRAGFHHHLS